MLIVPCVLHPHSAVTNSSSFMLKTSQRKMAIPALSPCLALLLCFFYRSPVTRFNLEREMAIPTFLLLINIPFAWEIMIFFFCLTSLQSWLQLCVNKLMVFLFADREKKKNRIGTVYIWQCLVFVGGSWPNPDGDIWFLLCAGK